MKREERVYKFVRFYFIMTIRNGVLGVGIFVVFLLMLAYGIEAFYPSPRYQDFCTDNVIDRFYSGKPFPAEIGTNCTFSSALQEQLDTCYASDGQPIYKYSDTGCISALKECNYCSTHFTEAQHSYSKRLFVIALLVGMMTLFAGYLTLAAEPVGSALIASGIGAIFYGSARNWENLSGIWRFLLLLTALILLIWITLRVNRVDKKKKWMFWKR